MKGYKKTEVGIIPEEWEIRPLAQLVRAGPTNGYSGRTGKVAGGTATLSLAATSSGSLQLSPLTVKYLIETVDPKSDLFLRPGDVLVQRSNTLELVGTTALFDGPPATFVYPDLMMRIRFRDEATAHWFWRYANSKAGRLYYQSVAAGSTGTMPKLTGAKLRGMPVPHPPIPEQRATAAALYDVDALLSGLDKLIAKKRDLEQAAMQELLTRRRRLPGFRGEWEERRLGQIARLSMGRTPSRRVPAFWGRGHPWLSIGDLQQRVISETKEEITSRAASEMVVIPRGTLVMSFKLSIGRRAFTGRDMYSNEAICSFNDLKANADFLYYVLGRTDFSLYGKQAVKGFTLNSQSLKLVVVPYPPLAEQTAIAAVLNDMDAELAALEARREKTRLLKQGMMQELLTGRTRLV